MSNVTCIDVSYCQTGVNYSKVKASGITAVIIRAGYGRETSQKDSQFETHYKNAKSAGLKVGAYWYSYANSVNDAKTEAKACLACIKGKKFDMPIFIDMEDSSQTKYGKSTLTSMAKAFCEAIKAGGYRAGVYANLNWFNNYLDYATLKKSYPIWLAQYNVKADKTCDIWQNSSSGKISGISGNVDTNIIYTSSVIASNAKTLDTTGFKKGDSNNGVFSLKCLLLLAKKKGIQTQGMDVNGCFGDGTTKAVNQLLKKWGYSQNGIAGSKFIKKLYEEINKKI